MTDIEADEIITGVFMSLENTTEEEATAFATATIALREQAARINPKPLTLDEMRDRAKLDHGYPVYEISKNSDRAEWTVLHNVYEDGLILFSHGSVGRFDDYVFFDYPPKEDKP